MNAAEPPTSTSVDRLARRVEHLEQRLDTLERRLAAGRVAGDAARGSMSAEPADPSPLAGAGITHETLPLLGRTLVVLGGAFALRAMTESELLSQSLGTVLGIGYALLWLILADRAAARRRLASAGFHAVAAAGIGYPLLAEATLRFKYLSPATSAVALVVITGLGLLVATRRDLRAVAWVFALAAAGTAAAVGVAARMPLVFSALLLLLALATLALAYRRSWVGPAIFVALVVDGLVLLLGVTVLLGDEARVREVLDPIGLIALQLALVVVYLGASYTRALLSRKPLGWIEVAQGVAVLLVGLGGAVAATESTHVSHLPLGLVSLLLAVASYAASFSFIDRTSGSRGSFMFCTSSALVFMLVALEMLFEAPTRVVVLAGAALVASWVGSVRGRATLSLHGAVYLVAATVGSDLPAAMVASFAAPARGLASWTSLSVLLVLGVAAVDAWLPLANHGATWGRQVSRAPKIVSLLVLACGLIPLAVAGLSALVPGPQPDGAALAVIRTAVLAAAALALSWIGRSRGMTEAGWLVYPLLAVAGAKLLVEDLQTGSPLALFASLALYGSALILAPRLARGRGSASG